MQPTDLAKYLTAFLTQYLPAQRNATQTQIKPSSEAAGDEPGPCDERRTPTHDE